MGRFKTFRKSSGTKTHFYDGAHRFEHWYVDNQVYFITARVRDRFHAFTSQDAKRIFWDRFGYWTRYYGFVPWITSLLENHYHTLGYNRIAENVGPMMQRIHGSVAKLVNDTLPRRYPRFWLEPGHQDYFDGCIRDVLQARRAFRYTYTQCRRHGVCSDPRTYPHTRVNVSIDRATPRAVELGAFLDSIPYQRYDRHRRRCGRDA